MLCNLWAHAAYIRATWLSPHILFPPLILSLSFYLARARARWLLLTHVQVAALLLSETLSGIHSGLPCILCPQPRFYTYNRPIAQTRESLLTCKIVYLLRNKCRITLLAVLQREENTTTTIYLRYNELRALCPFLSRGLWHIMRIYALNIK